MHFRHASALRAAFRHRAALNVLSLGSDALSMSDWLALCRDAALVAVHPAAASSQSLSLYRSSLSSSSTAAPMLAALDVDTLKRAFFAAQSHAHGGRIGGAWARQFHVQCCSASIGSTKNDAHFLIFASLTNLSWLQILFLVNISSFD